MTDPLPPDLSVIDDAMEHVEALRNIGHDVLSFAELSMLRDASDFLLSLAHSAASGSEWRPIALKLWALLDDIDTADDVAKGDDAAFRRIAQSAQQRRHAILSGDDWEAAGGRSTPVEQIILDARKT